MVQQQPRRTANNRQPLLFPKTEVDSGVNNNNNNNYFVGSTPSTPGVNLNAPQLSMGPSGMLSSGDGTSIGQSYDASSLMERSGSLSSIPDHQSSSSGSGPVTAQQQHASSSSASGGGSLTCTVCGDVATGRHYGSVACNGCKGFFRRTIRRNYKYTCRFSSNCQIDKHNRAVCRACRYARCIQFGMKVDAVQSERDLIGKRSRYSSTPGPPGSGGGTGSAAASPPQPGAEEAGQQPPQEFKSPVGETDQQIQQQPMEQFESMIPSCSSTASAPGTSQPQQPPSFLTSQSQFSSLENDEPVPRKRSFSSGSKFEQFAARRQFLTINKQSPMAEQAEEEPIESPDPWNGRNGRALLRQLLCSEEKIRNMREAVIAQTCNLDYTTKGEPASRRPRMMAMGGNGTRKANENDILQSLHSQLLLVIEWAKTLKPFAELPTEDQTALLKNFAAQHVVLCVAYRSTSDFLKLINDSCIPRIANGDDKDLFYRKDAERVMDLLVSPMRFLRIDDVEFVALKACILFNPVARGLSAQSVMSVLQTRRHIFRALQQYVQAKVPPDEDRIGDLTFFILSPLQSLAKAVSEDVLVGKLSGVARLDQLMEELILEDNEPKESSMQSGGHQNQGMDPSSAAELGVGPATSSSSSTMMMEAATTGDQQQQIGNGEMNAAVAGFLAATIGGNSPLGQPPQSQWMGPNSPPTSAPPQNFICPPNQLRNRHLSSSASSSSNSPPLTLLQPVPPTPYPGGQPRAVPIGPLSPINEAELTSSALSSYVFGASLPGSLHPSTLHPCSAPNTASNSSSVGQEMPSTAAQPISPPNTSHYLQQQRGSFFTDQRQQQFRPNLPSCGSSAEIPLPTASSISTTAMPTWQNQQRGGGPTTQLLFAATTPSTHGAAIYSGTTPSPPQRFGIGNSN